MKKIFTSILVLSLVLTLCGCGEQESPPQPGAGADDTTEAITEVSTDEAEVESESTESATETDTTDSVTETATAASATERVILDLEDITEKRENVFSCTYDGVKHEFILCLPEVTENAPLVVMLHGYGGSADQFKMDTSFEETANPAGYAVCYVKGATDPDNQLYAAGWNSEVKENGHDDVGFLIALGEYLKTEYSFDENRLYVAGFSNGAFMTHSLAMQASDTYSGFVSVAGSMQPSVWDTRNSENDISIFQLTGEVDEAFPKKSDGTAEVSDSPAIEDVMDYWVSSNGLSLSETDEIGVDNVSILKKYTSEDKKNQVWDLFVTNGAHSWYSPSINEVDTNALIIEFFESIK